MTKTRSRLIDAGYICKNCHNISDFPICGNLLLKEINLQICVVEDIRDVMAIESTGQFDGVYHVLNGKFHQLTVLVLIN